MTVPLYPMNAVVPSQVGDGHGGLWYDRFFGGYPDDWRPDRDDAAKKAWAKAKTDWIDTLAGRVGDRSACEAAAQRLARLCSALGGETLIRSATWHFVTGLGNPHPVENGFLWHPTLATPFIPGSAVKGLVRSWVEAWMPFDDEADRLAILYRWFGSEHKDFRERKRLRREGFRPPSRGDGLDTEVGAFVFFDALPTGPVVLKRDVMTPHMGKWYEQGGEITSVDESEKVLPADWHDPKPICFLVADKPEFQFGVAPRRDVFQDEIAEVLAALDCALEWLGAGAKTAVGYGVMSKKEAGASSPDLDRAEWPGVTLSYNPGPQEISAFHDGSTAMVVGADARPLLGGLGSAAKKKLRKGQLRATVIVEKIGGKNWRILDIKHGD